MGASSVERAHDLLRHHRREVVTAERLRLLAAARFLRPVRVLIRDQDLDVPAEAEGAIAGETADGGEVVGLLAQAALVEPLDGRVTYRGRIEALQRRALRLGHT